MFKNVRLMEETMQKVGSTRSKDKLITLLVYTLHEILSLNDFNLVIKQLEDEIE